MAVMALLALPAIGGCGLGNGPIAVSLECAGTEESLQVSNPSNRDLTFKSITSSYSPSGDPELDLGGISGRDNGIGVMLPSPIFDDERNESTRVEMVVNG